MTELLSGLEVFEDTDLTELAQQADFYHENGRTRLEMQPPAADVAQIYQDCMHPQENVAMMVQVLSSRKIQQGQ